MRTLFLDDAPWRHKLMCARMEDVVSKAAGVELVRVWTADECISALQSGAFDSISLDHDLNDHADVTGKESVIAGMYGAVELTGQDVARWIAANLTHSANSVKITVHSWYDDGARLMVGILSNAGFSVEWAPFNEMCGPGDEDYNGPDNTMAGL